MNRNGLNTLAFGIQYTYLNVKTVRVLTRTAIALIHYSRECFLFKN